MVTVILRLLATRDGKSDANLIEFKVPVTAMKSAMVSVGAVRLLSLQIMVNERKMWSQVVNVELADDVVLTEEAIEPILQKVRHS